MKLKEAIYDLKLIIHNGRIPDESRFDERLIIHWLNAQRELWLTNEYNKGRDVRNNEVQTLYEVNFEEVNTEEIDNPLLNKKVLRSTQKIPRTIQTHTQDGLISIRPLDVNSKRLNYVSREQATYSGNGVFNRNELYLFKHNDYLYIAYGQQSLITNIPKRLRVEGVFSNPLEVDEFNDDIDNIYEGTSDYPMSLKLWDYVKGEILKLDVNSLMVMPLDLNNDDENGQNLNTK